METQELFTQSKRMLALGNNQECIDKVTQAIKVGEVSIQHLLTRAVAHMRMAQYQESLADCDAVMRLNPENKHLYFIRGAVFRCLNRLEDAIANLTQAIDIDPNYGIAFLERANCYTAFGLEQEAEGDLHRALMIIETALQGFCDTLGMFRTQADATEALVNGDRDYPRLFLPHEEIEKMQQTFH